MKPTSENNSSPLAELQRLATAVLSARTQRQMSRAALAEQAGASLQQVNDLERGYPIERSVIAAICRNLDLPAPSPECSPLIQLALLVRQRRGQARLSRAQLADKSGLTTQIIRSLESAAIPPSPQICMALLSVNALQLREFDVATFLPPGWEAPPSDAPSQAEPSPSARTGAFPSSERPGSAHAHPSQSASTRGQDRSIAAREPRCNPIVAAFLIRFRADGSMSIQIRPPRQSPPSR